jgi:photosystem II stability/assembly factor-like uncharacterized protein
MIFKKVLCISLALIACIPAFSRKKDKADTAWSHADSVFFSSVSYRLVGPFRGGRSCAVAGSYKHKNEFYFGATGGGVWKTIDGGSNWKNISDKYFGGSIGAVAIAPSDESVIYVGEGESTLRNNVSEGIGGMWRSDNGGISWHNIGLKDSRHIARILVHPRNPDIVWVAAMGHLFGPNNERGIYKTTDGGKTWKQVLFVNDSTACSDIEMAEGDPNILYAGMWHVIRTPYGMESGGKGGGLYKSTDGGETWQNISASKGLPKGLWGNVCMAVAPSNPDKVYAMIENEKGGLYMSKDAGKTWALMSSDNNIKQRAWYFNHVYVDPKDENTVYCLNVEFMKSTDGGKTFHGVGTPHSDHHELWIDPEDGNRMILADDGGAQISFDGAHNWSTYHNQPTAQIYRVSTDNAFPFHILGAQQDNSTIRIKSRTYGGGIAQGDWESTAGFESGYVVADPLNPDVVYGGNYGGYLSRLDHKTGENRAINIWPDNPLGVGADVQKYRFQWNFPIFFSPNDPKKLYAAGNHLFMTENEGQSWQMISPDLTTNDKTRQIASGGAITKDNTTAEYYCTIFTAAEAGTERGVLWTGSDDGLVHISRDSGKHWENVTPPAAGKWMLWNCIETDPFQKGTTYIVGTKYKSDDFTPYIFKTTDYGKSWSLITNGIPKDHFTRVVRADKKHPGLLYAGTEYGMYLSYDYGNHWKPFQLNLPVVPITDLTIKDNSLVVATQGRAFWIIDDLNPVQYANDTFLTKKLYLFPVNDAYRMGGWVDSNIRNGGMNPPNGVVFNYFLKDVSDSSVASVTLYDHQHKPIKTFSKSGDNKLDFTDGMNQFVWDMNLESPVKIDGMVLWNGYPDVPKAAPGQYYVRFRYNKDSADVPFTIKGDPNYKISQADYDAQVSFLTTVGSKFNEIQKTIKNIRSMRSQINELMARVDTADARFLKKTADTINKQLTDVEEALYQTKAKAGEDLLNFPMRINDRMSAIYNVAASGYAAPSQQVRDAFKELSAEADEQLRKYKNTVHFYVASLNSMIYERRIPVIGIKEDEVK